MIHQLLKKKNLSIYDHHQDKQVRTPEGSARDKSKRILKHRPYRFGWAKDRNYLERGWPGIPGRILLYRDEIYNEISAP